MATVTTAEQNQILKLVVAMFNAAPGAAYLQEFEEAFVAMDRDFSALTAGLGMTAPFQKLYPPTMDADAFATAFLTTLGLQDHADAREWITYHASTGKPYSTLIAEALAALEATTDPDYAQAQQLLAHKTQLAEYYSVQQAGGVPDLPFLQSVLSQVHADSDLGSAAAKQALLDAGLASLNPGSKTVEIATLSNESSTLVALPEGYEVLISGKNQPLPPDTYERQLFNTVAINGARGESLRVTLDNTAHSYQGAELSKLIVGDGVESSGLRSAVRDLQLVSNGKAAEDGYPHKFNTVTLLADKINSLQVSGNQGLYLNAFFRAAGTEALSINTQGASGDVKLWLSGIVDEATVIAQNFSSGDEDFTRPLELQGRAGGSQQVDIRHISHFTADSSIKGYQIAALHGVEHMDASQVRDVGDLQIDSNQLLLDHWDGKGKLTLNLYQSDVVHTDQQQQRSAELIKSTDSDQSTATVVLPTGVGVQSLKTAGFDNLHLQLSDRVSIYKIVGGPGWGYSINDAYDLDLAGSQGLQSVVLTGGAGMVEGTYSKASLHHLGSKLELLDVSGFVGKVTATLDAAVSDLPLTPGDVHVKVGTFGFDITDDHSVARVTTFQFTSDVQGDASESHIYQWKISGFQTAEKGSSDMLVVNGTVLDVSALGIKSMNELQTREDGSDLHIRSKAADSHFEIVLAGVHPEQLTQENFKFA